VQRNEQCGRGQTVCGTGTYSGHVGAQKRGQEESIVGEASGQGEYLSFLLLLVVLFRCSSVVCGCMRRCDMLSVTEH